MNRLINNKKGQYYPQPREPYKNIHPVLILGIVIVLIHFLLPVVKWNSHPWVFGFGVFVILIGGMLSVMNSV